MPPVNDDFADATVLTGANGSATFSNVGATTEASEPANGEGHSVWFKWTPASSRTVHVSTSATPLPAWDSYIAVFTGTNFADLVEITNADDNDFQTGSTDPFGTSKATWDAAAGTIYWIQVTAYDDVTGPVERADLELTWTTDPSAAPTLSTLHNYDYDDGYFEETSGTFTPGHPYDAGAFPTATGPEGTVVELHGTGLNLVETVAFGAAAAAFTVVSSTVLRATVPHMTGGADTVTVGNDGGADSLPYTVLFWGPWIQPADAETPLCSSSGAGYTYETTTTTDTPPDPAGSGTYSSAGVDFVAAGLDSSDPTTFDWSLVLAIGYLAFGFPDVEPSPDELTAPHVVADQLVEYEKAIGEAVGPATIYVDVGGGGEIVDDTTKSPGPPVPPPFTTLTEVRRLDYGDYYLDVGADIHLTDDVWPVGSFLAAKSLAASSPQAADPSEIVLTDFGGYDRLDGSHDEPTTALTIDLADLDPSPPTGPDFPFDSPAYAFTLIIDAFRTGAYPPLSAAPGGFDNFFHWTLSPRGAVTGTITYRPSRYRLLYDRPAVAPPQRQYPRDDGLGISTRRSWPPPTTKQYGLRAGPVGTVL